MYTTLSGGLPITFSEGANSSAAVVLNDELHILGGYHDVRKHYKWDGDTWVEASSLPYDFVGGAATVFNGEIHIFGGYSGYKNHYKWDGTTWTEVSTLPHMYGFLQGSAVTLNGEIHLLGGYNQQNNYRWSTHYKWDGNAWTSLTPCPQAVQNCSTLVLGNDIYVIGNYYDSNTKYIFYKWNGTSETWTRISNTLPYSANRWAAVVNGEIRICGNGGTNYDTKYYRWDGTSWVLLATFPHRNAPSYAIGFRNIFHELSTDSHFCIVDSNCIVNVEP